MPLTRRERLEGVLLGGALGDALGLPAEGLPAAVVARRFGALDRFRLVGRTGFVSDDTEQAALVAQSIARAPADPVRASTLFGRSLVGWFLRLPFGIGFATVRACLRRMSGLRRSGVWSAGNGAAMRAAVVGVAFTADESRRRAMGRAIAEVTHVDPRGVEGALYVAEVAANLCDPACSLRDACERACAVITSQDLLDAVKSALASSVEDPAEAARVLGSTGFVIHTAAYATWCLVRAGDDAMGAIRTAIRGGGDTDSIAAIVGGWVGARHGPSALDAALVGRIQDGPFGPRHLRALASALGAALDARGSAVPGYSWLAALLRNLALYPVVLGHGFRRLLP